MSGDGLPEPPSAIEGLAWPAVPDPQGAAMLAILRQLERTQWLSPDALRRRQLGQLRLLVDHARANVPFYRERLATLPADDEAADAAWSRIPILTRREIQDAGPALHARKLPRSHGAAREMFTSGSTGMPIHTLRSDLWELFWSAFTVRDHMWHRRDLSGKLATIRESAPGKAPYPGGARAPNWGPSTARVAATGPCVGLNVHTPLDRQVEWLAREDPDYLLAPPSVVERLAGAFLRAGRRLARLRQVETIAEALAPRVRELCREAWGVQVVDVYSAREAGYLALQCPDREHLHVQSEGVLVEVVDGSGHPCAPGESGRVIATPLHNFAMPLIRYEIGDQAEVGAACACRRGLPVLTRVMGRTRNALVLPSGERLWPVLSSKDIAALTALAPVRRYQFVQKAADRLELRLAVPRALAADEERALIDWVRAKFGYPFAVTLDCRDELPQSAAGKFEDFVSEIASDAAEGPTKA